MLIVVIVRLQDANNFLSELTFVPSEFYQDVSHLLLIKDESSPLGKQGETMEIPMIKIV